MYRKILVTLDGSQPAEAVLPHVEILANITCYQPPEVVLLMVCEPLAISADLPGASMPLNWAEQVKQTITETREAAQRYLSTVQQKLNDDGIEVATEVLTGDPADEITKYANNNQFDLTVIGTHGWSRTRRWAFGSVSNKVLHSISSPILVVRVS